MSNRVIIGRGAAAASYLVNFPPQSGEEVILIGRADPWSLRLSDHRLGQPKAVLNLDRRTYVATRDTDLQIPSRTSNKPPEEPFLKTGEFVTGIDNIIKGAKATTIDATVKTIIIAGQQFAIGYEEDTGGGKTLLADKLIVAAGPGPARQTKAVSDGVNIFTGSEFQNSSIVLEEGASYVVEGGSATAAWAAERAIKAKASAVFWIQRPDRDPLKNTIDKRFEAAFPSGNRNIWLQNRNEVVRFLQAIASVTVVGDQKKTVETVFEGGAKITTDYYISAIGADGNAEDKELVGIRKLLKLVGNTLEGVYDKQGIVDPKKKALLGYANEAGTFLVVGSAVYAFEGKGEANSEYLLANKLLPPGARPPEGVPTITTTIEALKFYLEGGARVGLAVDDNRANFYDMDEWIKYRELFSGLGFSEETRGYLARFISDNLIGFRATNSTPFGLSGSERAEIRLFFTGSLGRETSEILRVLLEEDISTLHKRGHKDLQEKLNSDGAFGEWLANLGK